MITPIAAHAPIVLFTDTQLAYDGPAIVVQPGYVPTADTARIWRELAALGVQLSNVPLALQMYDAVTSLLYGASALLSEVTLLVALPQYHHVTVTAPVCACMSAQLRTNNSAVVAASGSRLMQILRTQRYSGVTGFGGYQLTSNNPAQSEFQIVSESNFTSAVVIGAVHSGAVETWGASQTKSCSVSLWGHTMAVMVRSLAAACACACVRMWCCTRCQMPRTSPLSLNRPLPCTS